MRSAKRSSIVGAALTCSLLLVLSSPQPTAGYQESQIRLEPTESLNSPTELLTNFADPHASQRAVVVRYKQIQDTEPSSEEVGVFRALASSEKSSSAQWSFAVHGLFNRHVASNMTLGELADLLEKPFWLKRDTIHALAATDTLVGRTEGQVPLKTAANETLFEIAVPDRLPAILLRVRGADISERAMYDTLRGRDTPFKRSTITASAVWPHDLVERYERQLGMLPPTSASSGTSTEPGAVAQPSDATQEAVTAFISRLKSERSRIAKLESHEAQAAAESLLIGSLNKDLQAKELTFRFVVVDASIDPLRGPGAEIGKISPNGTHYVDIEVMNPQSTRGLTEIAGEFCFGMKEADAEQLHTGDSIIKNKWVEAA